MYLFIFLQICTLFWEKDTDLADISEIKKQKKGKKEEFPKENNKKDVQLLDN